MQLSTPQKIKSLIITGIIMALGIALFKYLPVYLFGKDILFDASLHITIAVFVLYIGWYFIDQNKNWRNPYLLLSCLIVIVIAIQRIISNAHNDIGLLLGLILSLFAIIISRQDYFKNKFNF
jgi:membrane protein CcdC involved in cytochrome C biogenesis